MSLKVYNTLTRKKEEFEPISSGRVGMYVCGITAYDSCHLGHARAAISFDIVARYLKFKGYNILFVKNYTDVDDKIINRANEEKKSCKEISEFYIDEYRNEMRALGNISPDIEPKATEHITDMIETIEKLISNGYAYEKNGNVFFSVRKFKGYGKLSGKKIDELESGARISVNEEKEDPLDFALWKKSKPDEPKWHSPWGEGRPGWHIECSAMSSKYLGQPFDIHGGGRDLVFPHHENEIAQAEGAEGKPFVKYWLHNGFVNINAEKMSKSLGNITTINEMIKRHGAEVIRYFVISNHYRSPIDYTEKAINDSRTALNRFYETAKRMSPPSREVKKAIASGDSEKDIARVFFDAKGSITRFMDDDFNTAGAIGAIFDVVRGVNRYLDSDPDENSEFYQWVLTEWKRLRNDWSTIFGMFGTDPIRYFEEKGGALSEGDGIDREEIEALIKERKEAREAKDFGRADEIRDRLDALGVILKDIPGGKTEWRKK